MKRIVSLLVFLQCCIAGWSQTMTIEFKNGSTTKYNMKDIKSIDFIEENDDSDNEVSLSIHLDRAGTLSSRISTSQASNLLKLKLSGHMDARDFDFIKWDCMKVEVVDLSNVEIDSYRGKEGTQEGENVSYEANEIPSGAFFYWANVHKYVYDGMPIDEGMPSLKKIVLPQGIKTIRRNAFARAYNLTDINIPEGVEAIDYVAFAICNSLEELKLPSTLKKVGQLAFADMRSLKRVYISSSTPPTATSNSFQGVPRDAVLYVPSGSENQYRNAVGWNTFTSIVGIAVFPNDEIDSGGSGSGASSTFTITRDGEVNEVEITDWIYPQFTNKALKKGAGFSLDDYPLFRGTIYIIFPLEQYGEYLSPSYFPVGYSDFDSYATDIVYVSIEQAGWYGEYISGSARVVKNNGNSITVQFNNYMFYVERNSRSRKYTLNGTLEFKCYMYD